MRGGRATVAAVVVTACVAAAVLVCSACMYRFSSRRHQLPQPPPPPLTRRLPDCIIIGARKCGTRALLDFLDAHPSVAAAKGEVHYFDRPDNRRLGLAWYRDQMPASGPGQITVEKTPAYFVTEAAPHLTRLQMRPDLRLLLIVRDPVTRVISDYAQHLHRRAKAGRPARPLERLVLTRAALVNPRAKMVSSSVYHRHLRRWLGQFPAGRIHIVDGDRLIAEPHSELRLVEKFLGLPQFLGQERFAFNATKGFYCLRTDGQHRCLGSEKGRRHPPVSPVTVAKLRSFFAPHDHRLASLTGRRFSWMRQPRNDSAVS